MEAVRWVLQKHKLLFKDNPKSHLNGEVAIEGVTQEFSYLSDLKRFKKEVVKVEEKREPQSFVKNFFTNAKL